MLKNLFVALCLFLSVMLEASWSPPVTISPVNSDSPEVKLDAFGNATAVWKSFNGSNFIIQAVTGVYGESWSTPVNLSAPGQDANLPELAIDAAGNVVVVWSRFDGTNHVVQAVTSLTGTPVNLSVSDQDAIFPEVASGPANVSVAVWMKFNGTNYFIQASERNGTNTWSSPVNLTSPLSGNAVLPQVTVDLNGNAIAIWTLNTGVNTVVQAAFRPFGSSWSVPQTISTPLTDNFEVQIAIDPLGRATAVWRMNNGTNNIIQTATFSGGVWSAPQNISVVGLDGFFPQIAVDAQNNAVAVWQQTVSAHNTIEVVSRIAGVWGTPLNLTTGLQNFVSPMVAVDAAGDAVVTWKETLIADSAIQAVMHPFNGTWSAISDVSTSGQDSDAPDLAMNARGDAIIVWRNNFLTQIQEARGGFFVAPPSSFVGTIVKHRFINRTKYVLQVSWSASLSPDILFYQVFRDSQLILTVLPTDPFFFEVNFNRKRSATNYTIIAVNVDGIQSVPLNIRIAND